MQKVAGTDITRIRSSVLADALREGDATIARIVEGAARQIGIAVAGAIHLIAPDVIILGGGLVEAMPDVFVKGVSAAARERVMRAFKDTFSVVTAELGDDAGVLGAAAWARKTLAGE